MADPAKRSRCKFCAFSRMPRAGLGRRASCQSGGALAARTSSRHRASAASPRRRCSSGVMSGTSAFPRCGTLMMADFRLTGSVIRDRLPRRPLVAIGRDDDASRHSHHHSRASVTAAPNSHAPMSHAASAGAVPLPPWRRAGCPARWQLPWRPACRR